MKEGSIDLTGKFSELSEAEREATIARNRALLAELDLSLDIPQAHSKSKTAAKPKNKSSQSTGKKRKRSVSPAPTRETRQSTRLRRTAPPANETPEQKRKREVCHRIIV